MISNEVLEKLYNFPFSSREIKVLLFVIRKTWGWHKKEDNISYNQIAIACSMDRRNAIRTVKKLVAKMTLVIKKGYINTISFNKNYDEWVVSNQPLVVRMTLPSVKPTTTLVSNQPLELVSNQPPTKDIKILLQKKLIQKKEYTHLNKYQKINNVQEKDMIEIAEKYKVPLAFVKSKLDDMIIWAESKPNNSKLKGRNWRITLMKFVKEDAIKIVNKNYDPTRQNIDGRNL